MQAKEWRCEYFLDLGKRHTSKNAEKRASEELRHFQENEENYIIMELNNNECYTYNNERQQANEESVETLRKTKPDKPERRKYPTVLRKREKNHICPFCKNKFARIALHMKNCTERSLELCKYCNLPFHTIPQLISHINEKHPEGLPACHICFSTFESYQKRNYHVRIFHNENTHKCEMCNMIFQNKYSLMGHKVRRHSEVINKECPVCKQIITTKYLYDNHMKKHTPERNYKCRYCEKGFMQMHHRTNHERNHTGERPFLCDVCGKTFKKDDALKSHLAQHEKLTAAYKLSGLQMEMEEIALFHCKKCNTMFKTGTTYRLHACEKRLPHVCSFCEKRFSTIVQLNNHIAKHKDVRKWICEECGDAFKRAAHLRGHVRRVHLKLKNYVCLECGMSFVQKYELTDHVRLHSDETPYQCKQCTAAFKWRNALRVHERVHAKKNKKNSYSCDVCEEIFSSNEKLVAHSTIHSSVDINLVVSNRILLETIISQIGSEDQKQHEQLPPESALQREYETEDFSTSQEFDEETLPDLGTDVDILEQALFGII